MRELCSQMGVSCHVRRLTGAGQIRGGSAEGHWRKLRYDAFSSVMQESNSEVLALGHTAEDLAETFLFHLVRGTGLDGLQFQFESVSHGMRIVRPLWKTRRAQIERVLRENDQPWIEDLSNKDTRHSRNLIRHDVMPVLQKINPDAVGAIVRASEIIGGKAQQADRTSHRQTTACGRLMLHDMRETGNLSLADALRNYAATYGATLASRQTAQAVQMVVDSKVGTVSLAGASTLVITQDFVWLFEAQEPSDNELATAHASRFGGLYACIDGQFAPIDAADDGRLLSDVPSLTGKVHTVTLTGAEGKLALRNRHKGERVGRTSLKKLLNEHRVPWYLRDYLVFVAVMPEDRIVGVISDNEHLRSKVTRHANFPALKITVDVPATKAG